MRRRYRTVDVFTRTRFGGNPLAVVLDAQGLDTAAMQAIAREFNYAETTFVLPPQSPAHRAQVRIFSPGSELPFAGHPNIGTAYVLGSTEPGLDTLMFEEKAGLVGLTLLREDGRVVGAELQAPAPLQRGSMVSPARAAACLGLDAGDVDAAHRPQIASVGLPFLVVRLASLEAMGRARSDLAEMKTLLPLDGADGIYMYVRTGDELAVRMFAPLDGIAEDAATGSAAAAIVAFLADLDQVDTLALTVRQGTWMGRPSLLHARAGGGIAYVGGFCVDVMDGTLEA